MKSSNDTAFSDKCFILSEALLGYRNVPELQSFFQYNDLGVILAYAIDADIVPATERAQTFVNESFAQLLKVFDVKTDTGFSDFAEIIGEEEEE